MVARGGAKRNPGAGQVAATNCRAFPGRFGIVYVSGVWFAFPGVALRSTPGYHPTPFQG